MLNKFVTDTDFCVCVICHRVVYKPKTELLFIDIIKHLEHIGDYSLNISQALTRLFTFSIRISGEFISESE